MGSKIPLKLVATAFYLTIVNGTAAVGHDLLGIPSFDDARRRRRRRRRLLALAAAAALPPGRRAGAAGGRGIRPPLCRKLSQRSAGKSKNIT